MSRKLPPVASYLKNNTKQMRKFKRKIKRKYAKPEDRPKVPMLLRQLVYRGDRPLYAVTKQQARPRVARKAIFNGGEG